MPLAINAEVRDENLSNSTFFCIVIRMCSNASAAEVFDIVIDNYGTYYEVADKLKGWQQWYVDQKKIFESVQ